MGYESKVLIGVRNEYEYPNGNKHICFDEIARFDLCKMGYEEVNGKRFPDVFRKEIDFDLYCMTDEYFAEDADRRIDCYGEHCKMASLGSIITWLEKSETMKEYRRAKVFHDCLKAIAKNHHEFGEIVAVHFGY